jgi:hypothetical protein
VRKIVRETADAGAFLAGLPVIGPDDRALFRERVALLLDALPANPPKDNIHPTYTREYANAAMLLRAANLRLGAETRDIAWHFLGKPTTMRVLNIADMMRSIEGTEWAVGLLAPFLDDQRATDVKYGPPPLAQSGGFDGAPPDTRLTMRLCDYVAASISQRRPDLPFVAEGTYADLDRQIAKIKELLAKPPSASSIRP